MNYRAIAPGATELPEFLRERDARLRRQQRFFRIKNWLRDNSWALSALGVFFLLIGLSVFFLAGMLHELDRIHELQREIELLRALGG